MHTNANGRANVQDIRDGPYKMRDGLFTNSIAFVVRGEPSGQAYIPENLTWHHHEPTWKLQKPDALLIREA